MVYNPTYVYPTGMDFADSVKYNFMSGVFNQLYGTDAEDWSMIVSDGPFDLPISGEYRATYAVVAGDNLTDFIANAERARERYNAVLSIDATNNILPNSLILATYPSPFNSQLNIAISGLNTNSELILDIYNIQGRKITRIFEGISKQTHSIYKWNADNYPSGLYFIRAENGNKVTKQKVLLLK